MGHRVVGESLVRVLRGDDWEVMCTMGMKEGGMEPSAAI